MAAGSTFTHLHVASGYSLRHGASTPAALVARAVEHGMDALALTDRDGCYGVVRFAAACREAGIDPIVGVDLAVEPTGLLTGLPAWSDWSDPFPAGPARTRPPGRGRAATGPRPGPPGRPVRGGSQVDPRHPRVTLLALGADPVSGLPAAAGWARVCRLVSACHARGDRGVPVATRDLVAHHARHLGSHQAPRDGVAALAVLLGPASEVGRAVLARRDDLALAELRSWAAALPAGSLYVELVHHDGPPQSPASLGHAARLLAVAEAAGVPAVLTNAVRHAEPYGAAVVDVLDAARRLVPLSTRHVDRTTSRGHLASVADMTARAVAVAEAAAGLPGREPHRSARGPGGTAARLLASTAALADRCRLDPAADLWLGTLHLPEPEVLGYGHATDLQAVLAARCRSGLEQRYDHRPVPSPHGPVSRAAVEERLTTELGYLGDLGLAGYFLTVAEVCDLSRDLGVRVAARGSGAGSLVCHTLGISGVDPIGHGLLMERFVSPHRLELPDVDLDVESARRPEVYRAILDRFGAERVTCVSMMDTYRVRHAIRDVGAALGMPPAEVDAVATAFPHIPARDARRALAELPELRTAGLASGDLDLLFELVEELDGLPRHVALHPCGIVLSDAALLDRTPVEQSGAGFPMSQLDKDDVEAVGLLKLDVLGIRMQSAMAHAVAEVARVDGVRVELDDRRSVPLDDPATFALVRSTRTLGCFQIESPGQRELVGKFAPETMADLVIDISLFRPGPVKSDMVTPFLEARQGWRPARYLHPDLEPVLAETHGVVVFHEQVIRLVAVTTGVDLARADEARRAMGSPAGRDRVRDWYVPTAVRRGYSPETVSRLWEVLEAFASFGFCKAHAAAFALPTYQSAWLKAHHPAAFLAGVLTHDPGMYPKRLLLDDARNLGIAILGLDVNASGATYRVERVPVPAGAVPAGAVPAEAVPAEAVAARPRSGVGYGIRLSLADVKGVSKAEVERLVAAQPYQSLADLWQRAGVSRPVLERLVLAGGFDELYGLAGRVRRGGPRGGSGYTLPATRRRGRITRRDLLLQVAELDRWTPPRRRAGRPTAPGPTGEGPTGQLSFDLGDHPGAGPGPSSTAGLPEMTSAERVVAELDVLGLDASRHVLDFYTPLLEALGVVRSPELSRLRNRSRILVAGVKVATQTPPVRSGRRVVFLTLDDAAGAVDATFFEDAQGPYAATVFHSWLLLVRGVLRRTGPRGVSLRATGAWELPVLWRRWRDAGLPGVQQLLDVVPAGFGALPGAPDALPPVAARGLGHAGPGRGPEGPGVLGEESEGEWAARVAAASGLPRGDRPGGAAPPPGGDQRQRRVLVHASGARQSPYADVRPAGVSGRETSQLAAEAQRPPRRLWHSSQGSPGR